MTPIPENLKRVLSYQHTDVQALGYALWAALQGGSATNPVQSKTVTLTDAQIKALPTTPVEVIPAPGAGRIIFPQSCLIHLNWVADYANFDATPVLQIGQPTVLTNLSGAAGSFNSVFELLAFGQNAGAVTSLYLNNGGYAGQSGITDGDWVNQALNIKMFNIPGNLTGGDPASTLQVTVLYTVIEV